jgi:epoxyqueuosine reductase
MTTGAKYAKATLELSSGRRGSGPAYPLDRLAQEVRRQGEDAGLAALGIASAAPMEATRRVIEERKAAGLSGGMQFTYRNPARSTDPGRILPGASALVVGAWSYGAASSQAAYRDSHDARPENGGASDAFKRGLYAAPGSARPKGRVARYARHDHYRDLRSALEKVAEVLTAAGWRTRVVADDNALVDRAAAERAGLGWFGKNSNILLPGRGSWFLLGSVVTDAPLPPGPPVGDGCGACRRCLSGCPTGALVAPGVLDARKCLAWLVQATGVFPFEFRVALADRIYGCDDCQEVCPANRLVARLAAGESPGRTSEKAEDGEDAEYAEYAEEGETAMEAAAEEGDEAEVDLIELLLATDESLLSRYGRWYIPQRDPRYLRRNALMALGNVGDGLSPEVAAVLAHYLDHHDDLLRAHAAWACFRAGRQDLVAGRPNLRDDPSPLVRTELDRQLEVPVRPARPGH